MTVYGGVNSKMTCSQDFPTVLTRAEWEVPAEGTHSPWHRGRILQQCVYVS